MEVRASIPESEEKDPYENVEDLQVRSSMEQYGGNNNQKEMPIKSLS